MTKKIGFTWNFITIYGLNIKLNFWLSSLDCIRETLSLVWLGVISILSEKALEKNKPNTPGHWTFVFNAIIEHAGLRELPLNGRNFTWANNLEEPTFEKLDRILICPDWEEKYPLTMVTTLNREISQHTPLITDTGETRFENYWTLR